MFCFNWYCFWADALLATSTGFGVLVVTSTGFGVLVVNVRKNGIGFVVARGGAIKVPDDVMGSWARSRGPQGRCRCLDFCIVLSLKHQINPCAGIYSVVHAFIRPSVQALTYAPSVFSRGLIG